MEPLMNKYIVAPLLALIGIIIIGTVIEDALGIENATLSLFIAVGGIWFFAKLLKSS